MKKSKRPAAVVLLSGGLDSATVVYFALARGYSSYCLTFDYGQRHGKELNAARSIAAVAKCDLKIIKINLPWGGSSLLDTNIKVPRVSVCQSVKCQVSGKIPNTYVPGRNIIFLSFALSYAEVIGAKKIFIGAHAQDYSGYPDCRPEFFKAFSRVIKTGTKAGIEGKQIQVEIPLLRKTKAQIIRLGRKLGVPYELTWSCYQGGRRPCGKCDSCYYRAKGFKETRIKDPL